MQSFLRRNKHGSGTARSSRNDTRRAAKVAATVSSQASKSTTDGSDDKEESEEVDVDTIGTHEGDEPHAEFIVDGFAIESFSTADALEVRLDNVQITHANDLRVSVGTHERVEASAEGCASSSCCCCAGR